MQNLKCVLHNNERIIRRHSHNFYCSKYKAATCFGCVKEPSSGCMYQKM